MAGPQFLLLLFFFSFSHVSSGCFCSRPRTWLVAAHASRHVSPHLVSMCPSVSHSSSVLTSSLPISAALPLPPNCWFIECPPSSGSHVFVFYSSTKVRFLLLNKPHFEPTWCLKPSGSHLCGGGIKEGGASPALPQLLVLRLEHVELLGEADDDHEEQQEHQR